MALCVMIGVVGFAVRGRDWGQDINDISAENVALIEVVSEGVHQHTPPFQGIEPFIADPEDHTRLLALVQRGEVDRGPSAAWVGLGHMRFRLLNGRDVGVLLYWTGQDRGAYKINGTRYRGSSDNEMIRTLTESAKRGKPTGGTP